MSDDAKPAPDAGERFDADGFHAPSFRVRVLDATPSTNQEIKCALAAGEAEGLVVRSRVQTGGYGRQGRTWTSPEGGLYCSLLLRPRVESDVLPTLSLVTGLAVRRALASLVDPKAADAILVKWPNDVVVAQNCRYERFSAGVENREQGFCESGPEFGLENRSYRQFCVSKEDAERTQAFACRRAAPAKLCGISLEAHGGGVCVGVGVNVLPPAERPDVGGKNRPAYVADFANAAVTVEGALEAFLVAFAPLYQAWNRNGFAPFIDEFNAHASLTGCFVSMVDRAGTALATGAVQRVDEQGRLVLIDETGTEIPVSSGEAHVV